MTKINDFEKRLDSLRNELDWIPCWLSEVGTAEEIVEWRTLFKTETAVLHRLYRIPTSDVADRRREILTIRDPMLQFEKRLRAKYGTRMRQTISEMEAEDLARAKNDPEYREREGLNQKGPYD